LAATNPGYYTSGCNTGAVAKTVAQCSVTCALGYSGSAVATCSQNSGTFALSGCTRDSICTMPSSTTGYMVSNCDATCAATDTETSAATQATIVGHNQMLACIFIVFQLHSYALWQ
jgi:hypothetical protein